MNVVIFAAGDQGKEVALALSDWLPQVVPVASTQRVQHDLSPFTLTWQQLLLRHVGPADAVIFCVTAETVGLPDTVYQIGLVAGRKVGTPPLPVLRRRGPVGGPAGALRPVPVRVSREGK